MVTKLADVLNGHLEKQGWSFERLAEEAGLPRNTVYRWTRGEVKKIRHWQDLAKAARALDLGRSQTDALLAAGGHPPIDVLLEQATDEGDRELLARWTVTATNNLPAQLTSFVGRQQELAQLSEMLASVRLVTLTGPGGSGKTRLAIEAAQAVLDAFDEVCFVDLASITDPNLVIPAISQALGLRESPETSPPLALKAHLRDRSILLVLDNVEQVIEAAPDVTELLRSTRRVKALVTSRMRLHVRGEHELAVPPLPLPAPNPDIAELSRTPSVALFADRARAVDATFALTARSGPLVAEVCTRLDGLPLGIELAAARTRQMPLASLMERFPDRLVLADEGPRDAPQRQRTLRQTIAWSYDLLGPDAQQLLACASVFAGGFTEPAATAVAGAIGQPGDEAARSLATLVEHSLLKRLWEPHDTCRYEMLETIREFARDMLEKRGETEAATAAAATACLALAEQADLEGTGQAHWLPRMVAEHDNFRVSLDWCRKRGAIETGLRLCLALMPLWLLRDHTVEARSWLDTFMADAAGVSPNLRARGLLWQGLLLMRGTGDTATAARHFKEALHLFQCSGDLAGTSEALQAEGDVYRERHEWTTASQRYAESLEVGLRASNAFLVAHGHMGLALCAQETEQFDDANHHWQLTLEWAQKAANEATVALALNSLGEMARHRGEWEEAERYYEQTLRLAKELGSEFRTALALHNLGYVALSRNEPDRAERLFIDSLSRYERRQYRKGVAECLAGLAKVAASQGRPERAARLCGAAEAILEQLGTQLDTLDRSAYDRTLQSLKRQVSDRLESLLDEGRAMSIEQAVTYAGVEFSRR